MKTYHIGVVMNGVTGRMGTNQHLMRSIVALIKQGGGRSFCLHRYQFGNLFRDCS